jgi:hypothetical protein
MKRRVAIDRSLSEVLVNVLEHNTVITRVEGLYYTHKAHGRRVELLLALNRYKRLILDEADGPKAVPAGLWPLVLDRMRRDKRVDVMNHFVKTLFRRSVIEIGESRRDGGSLGLR